MVSLRRSPSGKNFDVVDIPECLETVGYSGGAQLDITLLAAGHEPGLYVPCIDVIIRTTGAGTLGRTISYDTPIFGTTSVLLGQIAINATGHAATSGAGANQLFFLPNGLRSTGLSPIVLSLTPLGISGTPVIDVYASISLIALPP